MFILESIEPRKRHRIDVILIRRDRKPRLHHAERSIVVLEKITARRRRIRRAAALDFGAQLLQRLEVVLQILGLTLGIVVHCEIAQRPVQVDGVGLLLEDREHDIRGGGG